MNTNTKKESIKVNVSVIGVVEHNGKFLLVQQARPETVKGKWGLPGGKVDTGESFHEALHREVKEETGLTVVQAKYLGCMHGIPPVSVKHIFKVAARGEVKTPPDELLDAQWLSLPEIIKMKELLRAPWVLEALEQYTTTGTIQNKIEE
ncbi:MAG: NUDIX hydrolase [Patescibacteria group bacterium]